MELTKVYVVQADNCEDYIYYKHWTEDVFASWESAYKQISDEKRRYDEDMRRIDEFGKLIDRRYDDGTYNSFEKHGLTAEEYEEYNDIQSHWSKAWICCPNYWIEEYVVNN